MMPVQVRKRPLSLVLAMMLCSFIGMGGMLNGFTELVHFSSSEVPQASLTPGIDAADQEATQKLVRARGEALDRAKSVRLPLASANLVLSGLLVVAASRASSGRRRASSLALQAIGANAALSAGDFLLSRGFRADMRDATLEFLSRSKPWSELSHEEIASIWTTGSRVQLTITLFVYLMLGASLLTKSARAFFSPVGPETAPPRDEDLDA